MAINACPNCGNARGSKDCEEVCNDPQTVEAPKKSLAQTHYPNELEPFIALVKSEVEQRTGKKINLDKTSRPFRNEIMAKAIMLWIKSKK